MLYYQIIGSNLRAARIRQKQTQKEVAMKINTTVGYYGRVERGTAKPNLERLIELCEVLEVPIEAILHGAVSTGYPKMNDPPSDEQFVSNIIKICEYASKETKAMILRVCREITTRSPSDT